MKCCIIGFLTFLLSIVTFGQESPKIESSAKTVNGPYLQEVTEDGFTVVWVTSMSSMGWVEIAPMDGTHFYATDRPKYYDSRIGRMHIGRLHQVRVDGLQPGTTYRYRIMQRGVVLNEGNKRVILGEGRGTAYGKLNEVTTLNPKMRSTKFWIVNDINGRDSIFRCLVTGIKDSKADFAIFNGDMTLSMESRKELFAGYLKSASEIIGIGKAGLPIFVARGDNETQGKLAENYLDYFPTPTNETYYSFRQGPAYFVVLDAGGDKPADDMGELDLISADSYREKEAVWLRSVVESAEYRDAPIHIAVMHRAPAGKKGEHVEQETRRLFVPLLNGADIDIMFCGHDRRHKWIDDKSRGTDFPILINSDDNKLVVDADASGIEINVVNTEGKVVNHHSVKK